MLLGRVPPAELRMVAIQRINTTSKPKTLEVPRDSSPRGVVSPCEFFQVFTEVHRELEDELR